VPSSFASLTIIIIRLIIRLVASSFRREANWWHPGWKKIGGILFFLEGAYIFVASPFASLAQRAQRGDKGGIFICRG